MALEFQCRDVGVVCNAKVTADSADDLIAKVAEHAADKHGVPQLTESMIAYAVTTVRDTDAAASEG